MKNIIIITVAGTSSRFSESIGYETLKCIYREGDNKSILDVLLKYARDSFDEIIIVGGYKFEELQKYIANVFNERITLLYNEHYIDYGSNYSLYLGVEEAIRKQDCEIVFVEGDLIVDKKTFESVCRNKKSVLTTNNGLIQADRSVAFYQTTNGKIKYIYDTDHQKLEISEPLVLIANSGQIWKFTDSETLRNILRTQNTTDFKDTNLNIVQKYFQRLNPSQYSILTFKRWYNCNTIDDYRKAFKTIAK